MSPTGTVMYCSDWGFPWDPYYKVVVVVWYGIERVSLVTLRGWDLACRVVLGMSLDQTPSWHPCYTACKAGVWSLTLTVYTFLLWWICPYKFFHAYPKWDSSQGPKQHEHSTWTWEYLHLRPIGYQGQMSNTDDFHWIIFDQCKRQNLHYTLVTKILKRLKIRYF